MGNSTISMTMFNSYFGNFWHDQRVNQGKPSSGLAGITFAFALQLTSAIDLSWLQRKAQMWMVQDLRRPRRDVRPTIHESIGKPIGKCIGKPAENGKIKENHMKTHGKMEVYPLVISHTTIESGHRIRQSEFSHEKCLFSLFSIVMLIYQRVILASSTHHHFQIGYSQQQISCMIAHVHLQDIQMFVTRVFFYLVSFPRLGQILIPSN